MPSWTTRSGRNFWSVKLSTLNPNTKIIFTARADNLLHLHSTIITIHRFQSICFKCNLLSPSFYWKLAVSFQIVHRGVHELAALQLQIMDTLCDCDGNIMIFGLVLCYTRWMPACTSLLRNWERGCFLPSQIQRCTTVLELSNVLSSDVHMWEWGHDQHLRERIHACSVLFVDVRACESNSGSHVAREPIWHSLGSKPEQNVKSGMFSFYLLGKFANTASKRIRIPRGKKWNHCKQGLAVCAPKRI